MTFAKQHQNTFHKIDAPIASDQSATGFITVAELEAMAPAERVVLGVFELIESDRPSEYHTETLTETDGKVSQTWTANTNAASEALTNHILAVHSLASQASKMQRQVDGLLSVEELAEFTKFKQWKDHCIGLYKAGNYVWPTIEQWTPTEETPPTE